MSLANSSVHLKTDQNGLALIEVLLSLGLSSVMFLVLFTAQSHSQKVLVYSQQLHYANQLLDQVAQQVWAYPHHYQSLIRTSSQEDISCLYGRYCNPVAMTRAWGTYWQSEMDQKLPNGKLSMLCDSGCVSGDTLSVQLQWSQKLAVTTDDCQQGVACIDLKITL
jgi:Tfp pilus assembly protein PilV